MKIARFRAGGRARYGIVEGQSVVEVEGSLFRGRFKKTNRAHSLSEVTFLPVTSPVQLFGGVGVNYQDHGAQAGASTGRNVGAFGIQPIPTSTASLSANGSPIVLIPEAVEVHYEGELVIVMGRKARRVSKEHALDYVLGYTCGNDVTEKGSWEKDFSLWRAKGIPTWSPVGPWIDTDVDPSNLDVAIRLNGREEYRYSTRDMVYDVPTLISYISQYIYLFPGDLIFTGTAGSTKPIKPGDIVEVEIPGIGTLSNPVVMEGK